MKSRHNTRYTHNELIEAKNYYFDEAMREPNMHHRQSALDFLQYFDAYFDIQEGGSLDDYAKEETKYLWLRNNLNNIEGKLERYFILKEKGRL